MSNALHRPMTVQAFLEWEARQEYKWEFDGFAPVAMTGGTAGHAAIQRNLLIALAARLLGKPCQPFGSDLKISAAGSIRYPDAFVVRTPVPRQSTVVVDPVVVFEVLSTSTSGTNRIVKNQEYRQSPSIQRYVMLEQDRQAATVFTRSADHWIGEIVVGDVTLAMPEIGIEVPLAELYEGLTFEEAEA